MRKKINKHDAVLSETFGDINFQRNSVCLSSGGKINLDDSGGEDLGRLYRLTRKLIYTKERPFFVSKVKGIKKIVSRSRLHHECNRLPEFASLYEGDLTYDPGLLLYWQVYRDHAIQHVNFDVQPSEPYKDDVINAEVINDFFDEYRRRGELVKVKAQIADFQKNGHNHKKDFVSFVDGMYKKTPSLLAFELALHYQEQVIHPGQMKVVAGRLKRQHDLDSTFYKSGGNISSPRTLNPLVSIERVRHDRARFFANLRSKKNLSKFLVDHVSLIDFARHGGHFLRVIFFFDGSKISSMESNALANEFGRYWSHVTGGYGWHLQGVPGLYPCYPLGLIGCMDDIQRAFLLRHLNMWASKSQVAFVKPKKYCKLLTMGQSTGTVKKRRSILRKTKKAECKTVPESYAKPFLFIAGAFPRPMKKLISRGEVA